MFRKPELELTSMTRRGAHGQDLGAPSTILGTGFFGSVNEQFRAVITRDAKTCFSSKPMLRSKGYKLVVQKQSSYLLQETIITN